MGKSYGLIEITGVTAAVDALDIMCKAAGSDSGNLGKENWAEGL